MTFESGKRYRYVDPVALNVYFKNSADGSRIGAWIAGVVSFAFFLTFTFSLGGGAFRWIWLGIAALCAYGVAKMLTGFGVEKLLPQSVDATFWIDDRGLALTNPGQPEKAGLTRIELSRMLPKGLEGVEVYGDRRNPIAVDRRFLVEMRE